VSINIFGEYESEDIYEELRCPNECDTVRVGCLSHETFTCPYCLANLVGLEDYDSIVALRRKARLEDDQALQSLTNFIVLGNG
jgi:hypothetical protein